jgi:hypothetical protein
MSGTWVEHPRCDSRPHHNSLFAAGLRGRVLFTYARNSAFLLPSLILRTTIDMPTAKPEKSKSKVKESSIAILVRASITRRSGRDTGHTFSKQRDSANSVTDGGQESGDYARAHRQCMRSRSTGGARIQKEPHEGPPVHRERHIRHRQGHIELHIRPKRQRRHGRAKVMTRLHSIRDGSAPTDVMAYVAPAT